MRCAAKASKHKGDWRQMLDELAATRHQIASERSDNAREHAQMREQRARDIDDEEERHKREAKGSCATTDGGIQRRAGGFGSSKGGGRS